MAIIDVRSDVTGVLLSVDVTVGQSIDEDDTIVVLESMKMHIPVASPQAGKVVEILLPEEGEVVNEGAIVIRLEV